MDCLCDLDKKDIENKLEAIKKLVDKPRFICVKCARAANKEDLVCKPVSIKPIDDSP
ncbi:hypothetical protein H8E52_12530 [bacterium]|nr:hypothetical protein [bacterium]